MPQTLLINLHINTEAPRPNAATLARIRAFARAFRPVEA